MKNIATREPMPGRPGDFPRSRRRITTQLVCIALASIALAIAPPSSPVHATTMLRMPLDRLVKRSTKIVSGIVEHVQVEPDASGHLWSLYTLRSTGVAKGRLSSRGRFSYRCRGGELNGRIEYVPGTPRPKVGDEGIFFYAPKNEVCQVMGWRQGQFPILEEATHRKIAFNHEGRPILALTTSGLVLGMQPSWLKHTREDELDVVGAASDASVPTADTAAAASPAEMVTELAALARFYADESGGDVAADGTTSVVGPSTPSTLVDLTPTGMLP